ncbi:nucleotidyltransferase domain protein [Blautia obeum ATCC 29174]|jgi:predicted nucleotidyltransferase|uniref:Nucleotidyltransferase domain protein n=3 Tax=Blautia TaxID=572511 RepID=A5ZXL5_9FIRM|nr:nucleotidyltransferase domain protein [Blautia obeum ATCC 29174]
MTSALILVGKKMPENRRDDMCTKNELNSILQKLTQIYRSVYGENLVQVILYGSYARGDYHTDSDVDVVAIVHGDRKTLQQQLKKVWDFSCELELEYDTILSPTVIPYEEFKQYQTILPYYRNISQEGVVISA